MQENHSLAKAKNRRPDDPAEVTRLQSRQDIQNTIAQVFPQLDKNVLADLFKDYLPYDPRINDFLTGLVALSAMLGRKGREAFHLSQGLWTEIKSLLPNENDVERPTSAAWFTGHILLEKVRAGNERRDVAETLLGESGIWGYQLQITERPQLLDDAEIIPPKAKVARIITEVVSGLTQARTENENRLHTFFSRFQNILFKGVNFTTRMNSNTWISKSVLSGAKEWRMVFPPQAEKMRSRTEHEMSSILIIRNVNGVKRYFTLNTIDILTDTNKTAAQIQAEVEDFLDRQGSPVPPDTHSLFEVEVVIEDETSETGFQQTFESKQDIRGTAKRAPVMRGVLSFSSDQSRQLKLNEFTAWAPHLTGNENHIRRILDSVLQTAPELRESHFSDLNEEVPEILWHKKQGEGVVLAEAVTKFCLTEYEVVLLKLLKQQTGIGLATILALTQSSISRDTTYICVNAPFNKSAQHEGDLGIIPSPGTNEAKILQLLDSMLKDIERIKFDPEGLPDEDVCLSFAEQLRHHMAIVNKNIELAQAQKPLLGAIETNVAMGATKLLSDLFPAAGKFLANASSQISSVQQKTPNPITFFSATSLDSTLSIGANSIVRKQEITVRDPETKLDQIKEKTFIQQIISLRERFRANENESLDLEQVKRQLQRHSNGLRADLERVIYACLIATAKSDVELRAITSLLRDSILASHQSSPLLEALAQRAQKLIKRS